MIFYHLAQDDNYESTQYGDTVDWETIQCPVYSGHQRAGQRIGNLEINLKGPIDREFFWTILSELIVTENFIGLLNENGFTGFETRSASIVNKKSDIQFFEFIPVGKAGPATNMELVSRCEYCGAEKYRELNHQGDKFTPLQKVVFNKEMWDGSDIFTVTPLYRYILITERVKEMIIKNKLRGSIITKSENFSERVY